MTEIPRELNADELAGIAFRVSRHSDTSGDGRRCVEVGALGDGSGRVAIRHSRHPEGPVLVYTAAEWQAFTAGVRDGEFDFS